MVIESIDCWFSKLKWRYKNKFNSLSAVKSSYSLKTEWLNLFGQRKCSVMLAEQGFFDVVFNT